MKVRFYRNIFLAIKKITIVQLRFQIVYILFLGQTLNQKQTLALAKLDENSTWQKKLMVNYRKEIGILIPFLFFQITWWCLAIRHDYFSYFAAANPGELVKQN